MQAKILAEKVRVLCWVMTAPGNHDLKAKHVKATWGKRCNILLFMSTEEGKQMNGLLKIVKPRFSNKLIILFALK